MRTLIIGVDGATFDLIDPMVKAGYLPVFERLLREGTSGPLDSWPNSNSAAAWTSMVTGYNPGQHGIYDFGEAPPQRGQVYRPVTGRDRLKDPFWRTLAADGQFAGVMNVPITYPADQIGFMLAGMDTPGLGSKGFAHPPGLYEELKQQGIDYRIDTENLSEAARRAPFSMPAQVRDIVDARSRATLHLMDTRKWDVLMSVFTETDRMQHSFWPASTEALVADDAHPLRSVYQQIDRFLAQVLERLEKGTTLLIVSDHGFGPVMHAGRAVNPLLSGVGLLSYRQGEKRESKGFAGNLIPWARRLIPTRFQRALAMLLPGMRLRLLNKRKFKGIDWSRTKVMYELSAQRIWINLEGRQPEGIVPPEEYDEVCRQVKSILLEAVDPVSGRKVVRAVLHRDEIYSGPHVDKAADLFVDFDFDAVSDGLQCVHDGKTVVAKTERGAGADWKGNHRPLGILIAHGPGVKQGARVEGARIYDIAPTVLHLQGRPVPADMDGRVLGGLFESARDVAKTTEAAASVPAQQPALDDAERELIEQRLRDLGYID